MSQAVAPVVLGVLIILLVIIFLTILCFLGEKPGFPKSVLDKAVKKLLHFIKYCPLSQSHFNNLYGKMGLHIKQFNKI